MLTEHASYLGTVPAATAIISDLYETIDTRLSLMPQLFKLQGRLQLMTSQISAAGARTGKAASEPSVSFVEVRA